MISQAPGFSRVARAFATGAGPDFVASVRPNIKNVAHPQRWNNTVLPTPKKVQIELPRADCSPFPLPLLRHCLGYGFLRARDC